MGPSFRWDDIELGAEFGGSMSVLVQGYGAPVVKPSPAAISSAK